MERGRERVQEKCIIPVALACSARPTGPSSKGLLGFSSSWGQTWEAAPAGRGLPLGKFPPLAVLLRLE